MDASLSVSNVVIFDLETTSTDVSEADILELAAICGTREFHSYIATEGRLPDDLYAFKHIDRNEYETHKRPLKEVLEAFLEFLGDARLCGHNIYAYDLPVLGRALQACQLEGSFAGAIDTLRWAHLRFPTPPEGLAGYTLGHLYNYITGQSLEGAHLALEDCRATQQVLSYLINHPPEQALLRLWVRLRLIEAEFFAESVLEEQAVQTLLAVNAQVSWVHSDGQPFPPLETIFPPWIESGLAAGQFTADGLSAGLRSPTTAPGFSDAERSALTQISQFMSAYRPPQRDMVFAVRDALTGATPRTLIQAPTGTGKTKAYLYPSLSVAPTERIIVATHTKVLQQQALEELATIARQGIAVRASSVKSARESLCLEALEEALLEPVDNTAHAQRSAALAILAALGHSGDYDLESLPYFWQTLPAFRELKLNVETHPGRCRPECAYVQCCAYQTDLRQREQSSVWVTNQAYLLASLAQPATSETATPLGMHLVVDEAHNLEDVATNSFTRTSSGEAAMFHLLRLYDRRTDKGILASNRLDDAPLQVFHHSLRQHLGEQSTVRNLATHLRQQLIPAALETLREYGDELRAMVKQFGDGDLHYGFTLQITPRITEKSEWARLMRFERSWREAIGEVRYALAELRGQRRLWGKLEASDEFFKAHLELLQDRTEATRKGARDEELEPDDNWLYLIGLEGDVWSHVAQPIDLEPFLKPLWSKVNSLTLTSATLLPGEQDEFQYFRNALHLGDVRCLRLAETLPYERAHVVVPTHLPESRAASMERFTALHRQELLTLLPRVQRSLTLFTARARLEGAKAVLEQHSNLSSCLYAPLTRREREAVSNEMRDGARRAAALGTRAFMEGVDFPHLNLVGLERIPFPVPTPLLQRRQALIKQQEGDEAAWQYYLGKALLTFTQAFGRLVRDDRQTAGDGVFVLWDKRLLASAYYADVLETLPIRLVAAHHIHHPKDRLAFYALLEQILGLDTADIEAALQDEPTRKLAEIRRRYASGDLTLEAALSALLQLFWERLGQFEQLREQQQAAIQAAMAGEHAMVLLPTGFGKSLTFQLPALLQAGLTVVVSPLIALMKDQVGGLQAKGAPVAAVYAGMPSAEQRSILEDVEHGHINLLYLSPERINRSDQLGQTLQRLAAKGRIQRLVFDEAHCLSDWGHDFRPDYMRVRAQFERFGLRHVPIAALTATATPRVRADLAKNLGLLDVVPIRSSSDRPNLVYHAERVSGRHSDERKLRRTLEVIEWVQSQHKGQSVIVYASTRKATEGIARALARLSGYAVEAYHAGLSPAIRSEVQERFMSGETPVIVATNAFGMGVDKREVRAVVHFHPPSNLPAYIQEAGRAGRDGQTAYALLLHSSRDWSLHEYMAQLGLPQRHHAEALLRLLSTGPIRSYGEPLTERINETLNDHEEALEPTELTWLLNTMQQSGLLEYQFSVGKARLVVSDWQLLDDLHPADRASLERLGVKWGAKARQHWLDFAQLPSDAANALCDALHSQRRDRDSPLLQFATFEPCLEVAAANHGDLLAFLQVLEERNHKRREALERMRHYAETNACRRAELLREFQDGPPDPQRNREACCGNCNGGATPWQLMTVSSEDDIAEHYRPNRAVLEFLRDHRRESERYFANRAKQHSEQPPIYSGLGQLKIALILQGKESSPPLHNSGPIRLRWHEINSKHFGNLLGAKDQAIEKALATLVKKGWVERSEFQNGATYRINERGLRELERGRVRA